MPHNSAKSGWIDKTGRWVDSDLNKASREAWGYSTLGVRFSEGLVSFYSSDGDKKLRGYMDRNGQVIIPPRELGYAGPFRGGVARIEFAEKSDADLQKVNGYRDKTGQFWEWKWGYIDRTGRFIWRSK